MDWLQSMNIIMVHFYELGYMVSQCKLSGVIYRWYKTGVLDVVCRKQQYATKQINFLVDFRKLTPFPQMVSKTTEICIFISQISGPKLENEYSVHDWEDKIPRRQEIQVSRNLLHRTRIRIRYTKLRLGRPFSFGSCRFSRSHMGFSNEKKT